MPRVSVIIPVYNVEAYLEECLDSVCAQSEASLEILCVNDGSTDRSGEILRSYAQRDSRIVILEQENGGYGKAVNTGLDSATGEYIGIVEPDDLIAQHMYRNLYRIAKQFELDFIKADFYRFRTREDGSRELAYHALTRRKKEYRQIFNPSKEPQRLSYLMNTWSGIYRREFLLDNNIRHNETPGASYQDNGFYFQTFVFAKRAMILDRPYYMNRRDNPGSSVFSREKVYAIDREYEFIREILLEYPDKWELFQGKYWKKYFDGCEGTLERIDNSFKREYVYHLQEKMTGAYRRGEFGRFDFSGRTWHNVKLLMEQPEIYYRCHLTYRNQNVAGILSGRAYQSGARLVHYPEMVKSESVRYMKKYLPETVISRIRAFR